MKSIKFINIFCLIVIAISLVAIGAFVAMNQWVDVISNGLSILILAAMMLCWQSILRKLDELEKRLDGLSERVLPTDVVAALFAGLHMGKKDKDSPEPEKKEPDSGQPASSAAANEENEMGHIEEGVGNHD